MSEMSESFFTDLDVSSNFTSINSEEEELNKRKTGIQSKINEEEEKKLKKMKRLKIFQIILLIITLILMLILLILFFFQFSRSFHKHSILGKTQPIHDDEHDSKKISFKYAIHTEAEGEISFFGTIDLPKPITKPFLDVSETGNKFIFFSEEEEKELFEREEQERQDEQREHQQNNHNKEEIIFGGSLGSEIEKEEEIEGVVYEFVYDVYCCPMRGREHDEENDDFRRRRTLNNIPIEDNCRLTLQDVRYNYPAKNKRLAREFGLEEYINNEGNFKILCRYPEDDYLMMDEKYIKEVKSAFLCHGRCKMNDENSFIGKNPEVVEDMKRILWTKWEQSGRTVRFPTDDDAHYALTMTFRNVGRDCGKAKIEGEYRSGLRDFINGPLSDYCAVSLTFDSPSGASFFHFCAADENSSQCRPKIGMISFGKHIDVPYRKDRDDEGHP